MSIFSFFGCKENSSDKLILNDKNHNKYYTIGTDLINPYMSLIENSPKIDDNAKTDILEGIKYLDAVTKINPDNFAAFWIKGKGYQALSMNNDAYEQFQKSYELNKENIDVARELMIECLYLGKGKEAVNISKHALSLDKKNAGLIGNLALAYLINGEVNMSEKTINNAIEIDSTDLINLKLKSIIDEVLSGKRPKPTKYADLEM